MKRVAKLLPILLLSIGLAWAYAMMTDTRETIARQQSEAVRAADGDSFTIGKRKLRLKGIDAPEYRQTCMDASRQVWDCGKAAQGALIGLLAEPGLSCEADAADRFGRALAICKTSATSDIAAKLVADGMVVSNEFYSLRDYPDEEDAARAAQRGIWQGSFTYPRDWRDANPRR